MMMILILVALGGCPTGKLSLDGLAGYTVIEQGGHTFQCIATFYEPPRRIARLTICDLKRNEKVLEFDPEFNSLIRLFPLDVTNDGEDELVTIWTHGIAMQVAIFKLTPKPEIILHEVFRHVVYFEPQIVPKVEMRVHVVSGITNLSEMVERTYVWSPQKSKLVLSNEKVLPAAK